MSEVKQLNLGVDIPMNEDTLMRNKTQNVFLSNTHQEYENEQREEEMN